MDHSPESFLGALSAEVKGLSERIGRLEAKVDDNRRYLENFHRRICLPEIERVVALRTEMNNLKPRVECMSRELTSLKVTAARWGGVGGAIGLALALALKILGAW
ncbi:MAG: hypothetical protein ACE5LX_01425 [Nitrospinota bacterium]